MLNAAAGGGSFLTLPVLVYVGLADNVANATGTLALLPGYFAGAWAFHSDLRTIPSKTLLSMGLISLVAGASGAVLLLYTPSQIFRQVVPWLLLVATFIFILAPVLINKRISSAPKPYTQGFGLAIVSAYGGYFNGGIGIMLLALFGLSGRLSLNAMNGLKNLVSGTLTFVAVVVYAAGALISLREAGIMLVGATLGGYLGGRAARRIPGQLLRFIVICVGLAMATAMFMRA